jgi:non-heme chloroperoxidase
VPYLEPPGGHPVLYFEEVGRGPVILLVHGWGTTSRMWDPIVADLSKQARVVTFDLRGHGRSEVLNIRHDVETFADDISLFIEVLGLWDVTLCGWDLGAQAALVYAARGGRGLHALALASSMPFYLDISPRRSNWNKEFLTELAELAALPRPVFLKRYMRKYFAAQPDDEVLDWLVSMGLETPAWVSADCSASQFSIDLRPALGSIGQSTLVLHGRKDQICTFEAAEYMTERIPKAQLVPFDDSGHLPHLEERRRFVDEILAFVNQSQ